MQQCRLSSRLQKFIFLIKQELNNNEECECFNVIVSRIVPKLPSESLMRILHWLKPQSYVTQTHKWDMRIQCIMTGKKEEVLDDHYHKKLKQHLFDAQCLLGIHLYTKININFNKSRKTSYQKYTVALIQIFLHTNMFHFYSFYSHGQGFQLLQYLPMDQCDIVQKKVIQPQREKSLINQRGGWLLSRLITLLRCKHTQVTCIVRKKV